MRRTAGWLGAGKGRARSLCSPGQEQGPPYMGAAWGQTAWASLPEGRDLAPPRVPPEWVRALSARNTRRPNSERPRIKLRGSS